MLKPGIYRHYSGREYKIVGIGKDEATLEDVVIYQALYGQGQIWVRPLKIFLEKVTVPRFQLIMKTLKFDEQHVQPILSGEKTTTWRLFDDKDLQEGDDLLFLVKQTEKEIGEAVIDVVKEKKINELSGDDYQGHEKFSSTDELVNTFKKYYGDQVTGDTVVKIIKFKLKNKTSMPYQTNIVNETKQNENFRKVLFTGGKSQLVVMDIKPGEDIGEEVHPNVEQTLFFLSGTGKAVLDDVESVISAGDVVVVTPGVKHNFLNTGEESLKVYTIYAPANHIDGRLHVTKEEAEADDEDEEFGHSV